MIAYKFLAEGAVGPFTGYRWPRPGTGDDPWVSAPAGATEDEWIHACRISDLPYWLGAELWRVELDEPVTGTAHQIASPRGRLVEQVSGWDRALATELALDCALRARELAAPRLPAKAREALLSANDAASLQAVSRELETSSAAEVAELAAYVNTAAACAAQGAAAVSAFVVELLARSLGGDPAGEEERSRQARWLAARLRLREARDT